MAAQSCYPIINLQRTQLFTLRKISPYRLSCMVSFHTSLQENQLLRRWTNANGWKGQMVQNGINTIVGVIHDWLRLMFPLRDDPRRSIFRCS